MPSERTERQIDRLLEDADSAANADDWTLVASKARAVLAMDLENEDAPPPMRAAKANLGAAVTAWFRQNSGLGAKRAPDPAFQRLLSDSKMR